MAQLPRFVLDRLDDLRPGILPTLEQFVDFLFAVEIQPDDQWALRSVDSAKGRVCGEHPAIPLRAASNPAVVISPVKTESEHIHVVLRGSVNAAHRNLRNGLWKVGQHGISRSSINFAESGWASYRRDHGRRYAARSLRQSGPIAVRLLDRSLRSPGRQFAPAQITRAGKNAPSALPLATRAGSPTQRGHHAAGAFYAIESRPLTLTCANRCPCSRADLDAHVDG